jgi:hypothetical protein
VDAFGTDEVTFITILKGHWFLGILLSHKPFLFDRYTFVTLLKGNWFLGILLSHKPFLLDRCPVSGSLVGILRWLPVDGFEALKQCSPGKKTDVLLPISGT